MSRRKTIKLNVPAVTKAISSKFRHEVMFCEAMGRPKQAWVSDWRRTPPKNLPSPEEAAKMCQLLGVEPEDIITDEGDIALVRSLLPAPVDEKDPSDPKIAQVNKIMELVEDFSPEEMAELEVYIQFRRSLRQE